MNIKPFLISLSIILGLNQIQERSLKNDSLIYQNDINGDGFLDQVSTLDKNYNFTIKISNSHNTFITHEFNLKNCYLDIIDFVEPSTFSLEKLKSNFKFKIKLKPDLLKARVLNVSFKEGSFKMFGYYDVTKANNDPDNLEIIDYHSFPTKSDINSIQAPLKDLSFDSFKTPYFTSDRTSKDYCIDLKSGIVLQYPDDRIKYFLEKEPLSENNMVSYNDIGYYFQLMKLNKEAEFILLKVLEKFPDRIVAYINLGDAYWGLAKPQKAKEAYNTYISLMKKSGKDAKIPKRVYERVKVTSQ